MRKSIFLVWILLAVPAAGQDREVGGGLAVRWCRPCHIVDAEQRIASDSAPSFRAIAARPGTTASSLDRYLSSGHTLMPDFSLSPQERDALVAYILSQPY